MSGVILIKREHFLFVRTKLATQWTYWTNFNQSVWLDMIKASSSSSSSLQALLTIGGRLLQSSPCSGLRTDGTSSLAVNATPIPFNLLF